MECPVLLDMKSPKIKIYSLESIISEKFIDDQNRIKMWNAFLRKINAKDIQFDKVMSNIIKFLKPIYDAIIYEEEFFGFWNCNNKIWDKYNKTNN